MLTLWRAGHGNAGVRILLLENDFHTCCDRIMEFAESNSDVVNNKFPQLRGWGFKCRAVLADDKAMGGLGPPHTLIAAAIYDDKAWKKEVEEKLRSQMCQVLNRIQDWLERGV